MKQFSGHRAVRLSLLTSYLVTLHPLNYQAIVVLLFHHWTQGRNVFVTGRHHAVNFTGSVAHSNLRHR
eukprot:6046520-Amphidinium_carterae.5